MWCAYALGMVTGQQVKDARERLGESQEQFAERFHVDQTTVHRWETKGVPDRGTARVAIENLLRQLEQAPPIAPQEGGGSKEAAQ